MRLVAFFIFAVAAGQAFGQTAADHLRRFDLMGETGEATGTGAELDFMLAIFAEIQPRSISENKEICGYVGHDIRGNLVRTRHVVGEEATCLLPPWPDKMQVIASYHTHSTYSPNYDSEVPSQQDMETDQSSDIDGYVATPGGRVWFVDSDTMTTGQICGVGCVYQDPDFRPEPAGTVKQVYSYEGLGKRD